MKYYLECTSAETPPRLAGRVDLLWTQLPDIGWDEVHRVLGAWRGYLAKYGVVIVSRFDFDSETDLRSAIAIDIERFTRTNDLIADPFCGSSNVGEIALSLNRRYVGTDISPNAIARSERRLRAYA